MGRSPPWTLALQFGYERHGRERDHPTRYAVSQRRPRPAPDVLAQMPDYKPGKPAAAPAGVTAYKLSSNENPYGPLPSVLAAIADAAATVNRYPDMAVTALTERLAKALDVPAECIATGTGSVAVLAQIVNAACDAGDEVVFAWRSFEAYPIVDAAGRRQAGHGRLDEQARHRLDAMSAAITAAPASSSSAPRTTRPARACTPAELEAFLDKVPSDVLVVVDEAYVEFVRDPEAVRGLDVWRHRPNVVVLRTFSKAYGLAGLRVGYAVAHPPVAAALRKTATPFGVNSVAQVAADRVARRVRRAERAVESLVAERDRVVAGALATRAGSCRSPTPTSSGSRWGPTPPPSRRPAQRPD